MTRLERAKEFCDQAMMIDHEVMELPDWMAAFAEAELNREWIPVSERLPDVKGHYIFRYRENNCPVVHWYSPISADKDWYIKTFSVWAHILSYELESGGEQ